MLNEFIEILSAIWMIDRQTVNSYLPFIIGALDNKKHDFIDLQQYQERNRIIVQNLQSVAPFSLTDEYDNLELPWDTIAVYPLVGLIRSESVWSFSTMQFERDILESENNPKIVAHFISAKTGGGEAYYLDQASQTLKNTKKPVVTHFRNTLASAGVYLTCGSDKIFATNRFDRIGSVGTMLSYLDLQPILERFGAKYIEVYATLSEMKNKVENDLLAGKPEQFINEVLDPLNIAFVETVKTNRNLQNDSQVLTGRMFYADNSQGLCDGIMSLTDALSYTRELAKNRKIKQYITN